MENILTELNTLYQRVDKLLENENRCKNSDKWLIYRVLEEICSEKGEKLFIPWTLFDEFPSYESISRCRRKIQNDEQRHLPTDQEVIDRRKIRKDVFKEWAVR
jgi:hypothetical protein